ncbi:unnamed protein product [Caretta caretta]
MSGSNTTDFNTTDFPNPSTFILLGVPGLEEAHVWISIPFGTMYTIAFLGNFTILLIVKTVSSPHGPLYYFLFMLAVSDLVVSLTIMPKMLAIYWFSSREINFRACLTQLYCLHCFSVMDSGIFVAMAFDCYVILRAIFSLPTTDTRLKTFETCISHLCAILVFYIPRLFISLMYRFAQNVPLHFHVLIANVYLLMPPMLNPIIYGICLSTIYPAILAIYRVSYPEQI